MLDLTDWTYVDVAARRGCLAKSCADAGATIGGHGRSSNAPSQLGGGPKGNAPIPQFDSTINHIKEGVKGFTVKAAIKNIEGWEATLEKVENPGAQAVLKDLTALKDMLGSETLDGNKIKKLVQKLGKETLAVAKKAEGKNAEKIMALGEALSHTGNTTEAV